MGGRHVPLPPTDALVSDSGNSRPGRLPRRRLDPLSAEAAISGFRIVRDRRVGEERPTVKDSPNFSLTLTPPLTWAGGPRAGAGGVPDPGLRPCLERPARTSRRALWDALHRFSGPVRCSGRPTVRRTLTGDDLLLTPAVRSEAGIGVPSVMPAMWHPAQSGDQVGTMLGLAW